MKKFLFLLYGVTAYVVFLGSFLYAVGFILEIGVPKHINSPAIVPVQWPVLLNALLLGIFAIQHSVMARPGFKKIWVKVVPAVVERSTYVLLSSLLLIGLYYFWQPLTWTLWHVESPLLSGILNGVSTIGWLIVLVSTFLINHFDLFGLRQVWLQFIGKSYTELIFVEQSLYKYIRHPLMFGFIVAFWATPNMTAGHLVFTLLSTGYILVALIFEERDLTAVHGEEYGEYQQRVPKLIPFMKRRKKASQVARQSQW
jgi:protein-S-isoprenylcysteine O-methyltransferase Ste14